MAENEPNRETVVLPHGVAEEVDGLVEQITDRLRAQEEGRLDQAKEIAAKGFTLGAQSVMSAIKARVRGELEGPSGQGDPVAQMLEIMQKGIDNNGMIDVAELDNIGGGWVIEGEVVDVSSSAASRRKEDEAVLDRNWVIGGWLIPKLWGRS